MPLRFSALLALAVLAGCTWEGRPDGAEAVHSASDGYYEDDGAPQTTPLGGDAEVVEPLDAEVTAPLAPAPGAPVELTQPPPTTGTADATSEVEEALTPGTEQ
ncbi:hypothetical protein [Rubrivirga marina]|uniref:Uncharacterized protein n=1 Tax=Rubrivirga marina TaxID=1196024 RepID=A0A271J3W7_9BACT|nr:hypothetical protein [Rubrivirga marina]PAP78216.1 hypothetical protein BSZ37_18175 [Rubrivirga marina]